MIESRDFFESCDVSYFYRLAADLAAKGEQVTLFFVQNGALVSRKGVKGNPLDDLVRGKVRFWQILFRSGSGASRTPRDIRL